MSEKTDNSQNDNNNNEKPPANFGALIKQVDAEIKKGKASEAKQQAQKIIKEKAEHERAIRQLDAQLAELGAKFDAGIL